MSDDTRAFYAISTCPLQYRDSRDTRRTLPKGSKLLVTELRFSDRTKYLATCPEYDFELRVSPKVFQRIKE